MSTRIIVACSMLAMSGISFVILQYCASHPSDEKGSVMGYANGKDCFQGECRVQPTLAKCVSCCSQRCPQWVNDCIDACAENFPAAQLWQEIGESADLINSGTYPDYQAFCRSVTLIKAGQRSKDERIQKICTRLAQESESITGRKLLLAN